MTRTRSATPKFPRPIRSYTVKTSSLLGGPAPPVPASPADRPGVRVGRARLRSPGRPRRPTARTSGRRTGSRAPPRFLHRASRSTSPPARVCRDGPGPPACRGSHRTPGPFVRPSEGRSTHGPSPGAGAVPFTKEIAHVRRIVERRPPPVRGRPAGHGPRHPLPAPPLPPPPPRGGARRGPRLQPGPPAMACWSAAGTSLPSDSWPSPPTHAAPS